MNYEIISNLQPSEEEAAIISAVVAVLTTNLSPSAPVNVSENAPLLNRSLHPSDGKEWNNASRLLQQGLQPKRIGIVARWDTIARLRRRAAGGFYGIVGM